jgi:hypothetical protein
VEGDAIGFCGIVTLPAFFEDLLRLCKELFGAPTGDQSLEAKSPLLLSSSNSTRVVEGISLQEDESATTLVSVRSWGKAQIEVCKWKVVEVMLLQENSFDQSGKLKDRGGDQNKGGLDTSKDLGDEELWCLANSIFPTQGQSEKRFTATSVLHERNTLLEVLEVLENLRVVWVKLGAKCCCSMKAAIVEGSNKKPNEENQHCDEILSWCRQFTPERKEDDE